MIYEVNILNPKAAKLLEDLAELKLISLSKISKDPFLNVVKQLRENAKPKPSEKTNFKQTSYYKYIYY